jgi:ketosteroid isomerase-like protein
MIESLPDAAEPIKAPVSQEAEAGTEDEPVREAKTRQHSADDPTLEMRKIMAHRFRNPRLLR